MDKYRVWDKYLNMMSDVLSIDFEDETLVAYNWEYGVSNPYPIENYELMWSTGFRDKDGCDVYESDFVEIRTVRGEYYDSGVVKKKKGFLYIETKNKSIMLLSDFYFEVYTDNLELHVVGNVYETAPEKD